MAGKIAADLPARGRFRVAKASDLDFRRSDVSMVDASRDLQDGS